MQFTLTPEQESFRRKVKGFIEKEIKPVYENPLRGSAHEYEQWYVATVKDLGKKIAAAGWLGIGWPEEYGGRPGTWMEQLIFKEEMGYYENWGLNRQGVNMAGPVLLGSGTEEQKRRFLPAMVRGEEWWCQGYSEPEAGSDLAGLTTSAVRDGDYFRVNGQKVWTSQANMADWMFMLVRTATDAPKHKGISMLLVDMHSPGITVRPIVQMHGSSDENEVFFDDVKVPAENLVGEIDRGWYVAMNQLSGERSQIDFVSNLRHFLDDLSGYVNSTTVNGRPVASDPLVRNMLADRYIECNIARLINYRVAWLQSVGGDASASASICKAMVGPLSQRIMGTAMKILGLYGQLGKYGEEVKHAPAHGKFMVWYLKAVSRTFNAGTHEIQLNIIATRGLGLPQG